MHMEVALAVPVVRAGTRDRLRLVDHRLFPVGVNFLHEKKLAHLASSFAFKASVTDRPHLECSLVIAARFDSHLPTQIMF